MILDFVSSGTRNSCGVQTTNVFMVKNTNGAIISKFSISGETDLWCFSGFLPNDIFAAEKISATKLCSIYEWNLYKAMISICFGNNQFVFFHSQRNISIRHFQVPGSIAECVRSPTPPVGFSSYPRIQAI